MSKKKSKSPQARRETASHPQTGFFRKKEPSAYLVYAILFLACAALFLPLVVSNHFYYPFIFLKSILFRTAVQAMVLLYVLLALISPAHRPRFQWVTNALFAWFGVMLFCSLPGISTNAWKSWWGDFARMDGMFAQLHLLAFFFVLIQAFRKEREWGILFTASLLSGVLMGLTGVIQADRANLIYRFNPLDTRIQGATGNPDFFGSYVLLNLCISFFFLARKDRQAIYPFLAKAWFILLLALDGIICILDFASGGAILSAGVQFLSLLLFAFVLHALSICWFFMRRRIWVGTIFLSLLCLYDLFWLARSQTRAAAVGLAAALGFMALLYALKGSAKPVRWASALFLVLLVFMPVLLVRGRHSGWVRHSSILTRLSSTSFAERRFTAWEAGVSGILDRPVWGWGLEHYRKAFDRHAPVQLFRGMAAENWDDRAHNVILDVGTTTGFMGLAAFLFFYGSLYFFLLRRWFQSPGSTEFLALAGLLTAYLVQNLFIFDTVNTSGILFLILAYVGYLCGKGNSDPATTASAPATSSLSRRDYSILALTAAAMLCAYHFLVREPRASNLILNQAIASGKTAGAQPDTQRYVFRQFIIDDFERAENFHTAGLYQVREELANYASELAQVADVPVDDRLKAAKKALEFAEKSILEDPLDARHYMYAASLANRVMEIIRQSDPADARTLTEKALGFLQKAEPLGPNRPQLFIDRAQLLGFAGRPDAAIVALKKAMALDPGSTLIRKDLAAMYISTERFSEAESELKKIRSLSGLQRTDYERFIGLYVSKKKIAQVIALYGEQLQASPDDPVILAHLAAAYREVGDVDSARKAANRAAALSPTVRDQLESFLKTLDK